MQRRHWIDRASRAEKQAEVNSTEEQQQMADEYILDCLEDGELLSSLPVGEGVFRAVTVMPAEHVMELAGIHLPASSSSSSSFSVLSKNVHVAATPRKVELVCDNSTCPTRPVRLSNLSFHFKGLDFLTIRARVEAALRGCPDVDFFFADFVWTCKRSQLASVNDFTIAVFWDPSEQDHVLEVKRVHDEGVRASHQELFSALQKSLVGKAAVCAPARGGIRCPPKLVRSSSGCVPTCNIVDVSSSDFLEGIRPIFIMARCPFADTRLESVKMLCDLSTKATAFLTLSECVEQCCDSLSMLIAEEDNEDLKMLSLVALEAFLQLGCYREAIAKRQSAVECLIGMVINAQVETAASIQYRRRAAQCLALLAQSQSEGVLRALLSMGFDAQTWERVVQLVADCRTRELARQSGMCFPQPLASNSESMSSIAMEVSTF